MVFYKKNNSEIDFFAVNYDKNYRTVLEINFLSILNFSKIFFSQGPILKIEVLMTLNDLD